MKNNPPQQTQEQKRRKAYLSQYLKQIVVVSVLGKEVELEVKGIADGCVGISLWFDTLEHAIKWGGDASNILVGEYEALKREEE